MHVGNKYFVRDLHCDVINDAVTICVTYTVSGADFIGHGVLKLFYISFISIAWTVLVTSASVARVDVDSCATVSCRYGARCEHGRCVCPQHCPVQSVDPVCASDGHAYTSECAMRQAACQRSVDLHVVGRAPCDHEDGVVSGSGDGELTPIPFD